MPTNNQKPISPIKSPVAPSKGAAKPGPILLPIQAASLHPKAIAAKINELPHPHRWWVWALVGVVILSIVGGLLYWWNSRPAKEETGIVLDSIPVTKKGDLVARASTLPSGTVRRNSTSLSLSLENMGNLYPANYTYAIQLVSLGDSGIESSISLEPFGIDEEGGIRNEAGEEQTTFAISDVTGYSKVNIVVHQPNATQSQPPTVLIGDLPQVGQSVALVPPVNFSNSNGGVAVKYNEETKQYEVTVDVSNLPQVEAWGWRYQVWLAKLDGPYVNDTQSAGVLAVNRDGSGNHLFESSRDLSDFDSLIISLEPQEDTDSSISPVRVLSADLK